MTYLNYIQLNYNYIQSERTKERNFTNETLFHIDFSIKNMFKQVK